MKKPKKGDAVSLRFSYAGLVSYEKYEVERVRLNKVWIDAHDGWFDADTGRYSNDDGGASRRLLFDGGAAFDASGGEKTTRTDPHCPVGERMHGILGSGCTCGSQSSGPPTLPELAPHCNLCGPGHYHIPRGAFCSTPSGEVKP